MALSGRELRGGNVGRGTEHRAGDHPFGEARPRRAPAGMENNDMGHHLTAHRRRDGLINRVLRPAHLAPDFL
jgi:hypothetical protein